MPIAAPFPRVHTPSINNVSVNKICHGLSTITPLYPNVNHIYNDEGKKQTLDSLRSFPQGEIWGKALSNKWGRLAQGNKYNVIATDTIEFITYD